MENNTLYLYIDESGNTGYKINEPYFIICALILNREQSRFIKNIVKRITREISSYREIKELHSNEMSFDEKVMAFNYIKVADFNISYLVIDKNNINKNFFNKKNIYFNYMIYLMLENVFKYYLESEIYIRIDNRNIKITAQDSLEEYLNIELIKNGLHDKNIHVRYDDSEKNRYLQIVDLLANALFSKFNFNKTYFHDQILCKITNIVFYSNKFDRQNKLD